MPVFSWMVISIPTACPCLVQCMIFIPTACPCLCLVHLSCSRNPVQGAWFIFAFLFISTLPHLTAYISSYLSSGRYYFKQCLTLELFWWRSMFGWAFCFSSLFWPIAVDPRWLSMLIVIATQLLEPCTTLIVSADDCKYHRVTGTLYHFDSQCWWL